MRVRCGISVNAFVWSKHVYGIMHEFKKKTLNFQDLRAKFKQEKATDPWNAFLEAGKSLVKATDMGDALTEAGDIAPSEG